MSITPLITFKAGRCEFDESTHHVKSDPRRGYIYLYTGEDDLLHFCWRERSKSVNDPELDLLMFPADGSFKPYQKHGSSFKPSNEAANSEPPTNGRVFVLRFTSSSSRHFFWLQSSVQAPGTNQSNKAYWSDRDLKLGEIVNELLKGEDIDVEQELFGRSNDQGGSGGDDDTAMEDADGGSADPDHHRAASGGAGANATGGDVREEGEESREGGADGGRAAAPGNTETQAAVANFLKSLEGGQGVQGQEQSAEGKLFTSLADVLLPQTTIPVVDKADDTYLDELLSHLPPALVMMSASADEASADPDPETVQAVIMSLETEQKLRILRKVLRSPQFHQSLGSLTMALRDGGLPTISEALKIPVANGGYMRRGGVPVGGGDAVEAFLKGIKTQIEDEQENREYMDTD